jgi:hypothetical protein
VWSAHLLATRQGPGRLQFDQRHGLRVGRSARVRPPARRWLRRVGLCGSGARTFIAWSRCRRRRPRCAARRGPCRSPTAGWAVRIPCRTLSSTLCRCRHCADERLQRRVLRRRALSGAKRLSRSPVECGDRLPAYGAQPAQPDDRDARSGFACRLRWQAGDRHRLRAGRRCAARAGGARGDPVLRHHRFAAVAGTVGHWRRPALAGSRHPGGPAQCGGWTQPGGAPAGALHLRDDAADHDQRRDAQPLASMAHSGCSTC